ncbi:hypothetical protein BOW53_15715 [Solemya pervernicosa gill symbiont]|uniref:N-acetyltransferase domain-containing protein n=2 Tax=Gammaproteobacteria incertae sedis TaxID=118884 RepID=A0A1T2KZW8_9GAMM|nr:GNAT family N-acetyltransferase [Candidatus Reidiella endopervernicosa]OOZ38395.1 hypothetical protein BOW53_15715 [Solemya pervernicosa gill symbiont]QKQ25229.1 GNAT family N-acetyltransferase [Candidatus Reidiella endopervernicosa]
MIEYKNEVPDIKDYWPLYLSTGWNEVFKMDANSVERAIGNSSFAVSAYWQGELIGFARAVSDRVMYATIYDVMVLPEQRGRGIGSELVANITRQCKAAGVYSVHLFAADGTEPFYQRSGFQARPPSMPGMRYEAEEG